MIPSRGGEPLVAGRTGKGSLFVGLALVAVVLCVGLAFVLRTSDWTEKMTADSMPISLGSDPWLQEVKPVEAPAWSEDQLGRVLATFETQNIAIWRDVFRTQLGQRFRPPDVSHFDGQVQTRCAGIGGASDSFYCRGERRIYLDRSELNAIAQRAGNARHAEIAITLVAAHAAAHHIEDAIGVLSAAEREAPRLMPHRRLQLVLQLDLHAHCLVGIWSTRVWAEEDVSLIDLYLGALLQLQNRDMQRQRSTWNAVPAAHTFAGPSDEQIKTWFQRGARDGALNACDTFRAPKL